MVKMQIITDEDAVVIEAVGRVDEADAASWAQALETALAGGRARIVLNAAALEYIGGAGLRVLARTMRQAAREGREVRLAAAAPELEAYLRTIGLWGALPRFARLNDACRLPR
jgi:anti-anti-sigma factor